jgi:predicted nucleotidyltransferase
MFERVLRKIASSLEKKEIPYMIIGGQAVLLYGEPRLTRDIDITLGIKPQEYDLLIKTVNSIDLKILVEEPRKFVQKTLVLPTKEKTTGIRVDFIFSYTPYEREAIKRAKKVNLGKTAVNFASPEDVIIHKIFAGRARDLEDVKTILIKNPDLDKGYIKKWLKQFDLTFPEKNFTQTFEKLLKKI